MKKLVSVLLALLLALGMMSFASAEEPLVVTVLLPEFTMDVDFVAENNPVLNAIEEATGVRLQIIWAPNENYGDILNTTMADKDLPMLIAATDARSPLIMNSARAGAFWDLTDYVSDAENYPNLALGDSQIYNNISVDGRVYGIYRTRNYPRGGAYYRSDIAKQMGFDKEVKTIDDLTELAEALAKYSDDTYALNICSYTAGTISFITVAYGAPNNWGVDENGNIYPAHLSPAYLEGLNWLRHLYEIGGIDPNFAQISTNDWNDIERTNKAFMRFDCLDNAYRQQEWFENNVEGITDTIFEQVGPLAKADGSITIWPQNPGFSGEILVTKAVKEENLEKVMKFLDWCNSDAGITMLNLGVENETYWVGEDGYRIDISKLPEDEYNEKSNAGKQYLHDLNQLNMGVSYHAVEPAMKLSVARQRFADLNVELAPYAVLDPCYPLVSQTNIDYGAQLSPIISDAAVQYIAGIIDEDGLRAAWADWAAQGGDAMTQEYTEAYHAAQQ